jgi:hypothetical protein
MHLSLRFFATPWAAQSVTLHYGVLASGLTLASLSCESILLMPLVNQLTEETYKLTERVGREFESIYASNH